MENLEFALQVSFTGFFLVLMTLFVLYLILLTFGKLFAPRAVVLPRNITSTGQDKIRDRTLHLHKIVVITAAVNAYLQAPEGEYVIKKIELLQGSVSGAWGMQGRKELINMNRKMDVIRREKSGKKIF